MYKFVSYVQKNHSTKECPSIPGLKVAYQEEAGPIQDESLCFVAKRPWKNSQPNVTQGFNIQTYAHQQNNWTAPMPWKPWPQNTSWAQGWKNLYSKYPQYPQFQQPYSSFPPQYFPQPLQPS